MSTNTELIARLRLGASISRERKLNQGYDAVADEAADAIEALESDNKFKDDLLKKCSDECFVLTNRSDALQAQLAAAQGQVEDQRKYKDGAYLERNRLVALLSKVFPSGKKKTAIEGWSGDWHGCIYIDLPTGQASWHYHDSQAWLFEHLPEYQGAWDGHTTYEKYERIQRHANPIPQQVAQQAQPERAPSDADCDRAYRNGLKAGFSFGLEGNEEGFRKSLESYQREIAAHGIKQGGQHE